MRDCVGVSEWARVIRVRVYISLAFAVACVSVLVNSVGVNHSFKKKNTRNS